MRKLYFWSLLLMLAIALPLSTSCSSDSDNEDGEEMNGGSGSATPKSTVHRVDISFSGDTNNWFIEELGFSAVDKAGGLVDIRDLAKDGKYESFFSEYQPSGFREYSLESKDGCYGLHGGVTIIRKNTSANVLKAKFVFYADNKKVNMLEYETNPDFKRTIMSPHEYYVPSQPVIYDNYY